MTKLMGLAEPRGAAEQVERSSQDKHKFNVQVFNQALRDYITVVSVIFMVTTLVLLVFLQVQTNKTITKLDETYSFSQQAASDITDISVLAAFCANLPESTNVAQIQACIETNIKEMKK